MTNIDFDNLVAHAKTLRSAKAPTNSAVEPFMALIVKRVRSEAGILWGIKPEGTERVFAYVPSDVDSLMFASGGGELGYVIVQVSSDRVITELPA